MSVLKASLTPERFKERREQRRQHFLDRKRQLFLEIDKQAEAYDLLIPGETGFIKTEGNEKKTFELTAKDIAGHLDCGTKAKILSLALSYGPYKVDYTRNGRFLLLGGHKGSLAVLDTMTYVPRLEINVRETVRDVTFCHDQTLWAAAQKKYVYMYDQNGMELHCLREHMLVNRMEFLPYHMLLTTIGTFGELRWLDVSTGLVPAAYKTKLGSCDTMCQNSFTAVIGLGHKNGLATYWVPNVGKPIVQFMAHKNAVTCLEHITEHLIASAGLDGFWKVWDTRSLNSPLSWQRYFGNVPKTLATSQSGMLAIGCGGLVNIFNELSSNKPKLYLSNRLHSTQVESLKFQANEDIICIGHSLGVETMVAPGSCLNGFDSLINDPYETKKQRQEREIHTLLEKLPADMITFRPDMLGGFVDDVVQSANGARQSIKDAESIEHAKIVNRQTKKAEKKAKKKLSKLSTVDLQKVKTKKYLEQVTQLRKQKLIQKMTKEKKKKKVHSHALERFRRRAKLGADGS